MSRPAHIVIEGRAYRWRDILELRRQQIAAWKATRPDQPALFPLIEDARPKSSAPQPVAIASRPCSIACGTSWSNQITAMPLADTSPSLVGGLKGFPS